MKRLVAGIVCLALLAVIPAGCNTVEGAGRDLQAIGKGTSDAARGVNDSLTGRR